MVNSVAQIRTTWPEIETEKADRRRNIAEIWFAAVRLPAGGMSRRRRPSLSLPRADRVHSSTAAREGPRRASPPALLLARSGKVLADGQKRQMTRRHRRNARA